MTKLLNMLTVAALVATAYACQGTQQAQLTTSGLTPDNFIAEVDGKQTQLYTLTNKNGMEVCITNYGGRIVSIMVPGNDNAMHDVVLGFDSIADYIKYPTDFGASIGRYANRINRGHLTIDGINYQLPRNNFGHCLHGGDNGFQYRVFDVQQADGHSLHLTYVAKDGEEGFPGNLTCNVLFTLTDDNALQINYTAETDKPTVVNLTNHSYFNLDDDQTPSNAEHMLTVDADYFTPVDSTFMTTGEIRPVDGTPMDFRQPTAVGTRIDNDDQQLKNGLGYDHNWVLNTRGDTSRPCATLTSPKTGIQLQVYTNEPGIQIYTGNFLDGTLTGKRGVTYGRRASVCLETQKYPDTPNKPEWPSALLRPGEVYQSQCIYRFSVVE